MSTKGKRKKEDGNESGTFVGNIIQNYCDLEKSIVRQLSLYNKNHSTTTGSLREDIWLELFERIVPKKFVIEHSIFIIDSYYQISREVDLAIIDNAYTPYIFQYGRLKFVPIEAVAAVIECKSTTIEFEKKCEDGRTIESGLALWCNQISQLRTSLESVARMATGTVVDGKSYGRAKKEENRDDGGKKEQIYYSTQTSTRPVMIFCGFETEISKKNWVEMEKRFDFILIASRKEGIDKIDIKTKKKTSLQEWYKNLDHYEKESPITSNKDKIFITENEKLKDYKLEDLNVKQGDQEISLLTFNFQLNQLLMLINNPILFPHLAYAKMFNGDERKWDE